MFRAIILLLVLLPGKTRGGTELVPESTSPNGRFAVAFERSPSADPSAPFVWLVRVPNLEPVSAQLTPTDDAIYRKKRIKGVEVLVYRNKRAGPDAESRQMMFETLVAGAETRRDGEGRPAAIYRVLWSKDSRRVTIWAGEHRFAHASVFHLRRGRFVRFADHPGSWTVGLMLPSFPNCLDHAYFSTPSANRISSPSDHAWNGQPLAV